MKIFIITYDLFNPGQKYDQLIQHIKRYPSWAKLGGSSYLILSEQDPVAIRDSLVKFLDENDSIFVGPCPVPSAWRGLPNDVSNWILENQPKYS